MARSKSNQVTFTLSDEEMKLARRLVRREKRYKAPSVNLWARAVVQQYLLRKLWDFDFAKPIRMGILVWNERLQGWNVET